MKRCSNQFLAAILLFASLQIARADLLTQAGLPPLAGSFASAGRGGVTFTSGSQVPWSQVVRLEIVHAAVLETLHPVSPGTARITTLAGPVTITVSAGNLSIVSATGSLTLPLAELAIILPDSPWLLQATPKAAFTSSTQTQRTFGGNLIFQISEHPDGAALQHRVTFLNLDANSTFAAKPGASPVRTNRYDGQFAERFYLAPHLYIAADAEGYHNSSLNLYLQQSYGGGIYDRLVSNGRNSFSAGIDIRYYAEHFYGATPGVAFAGLQPREDYSIVLGKVRGLDIVLGESGRYVQPIGLKRAWQVDGGLDLSVPFTPNVKFTVSWVDDYLENAPNARKNYSTTTVGVSMSLAGSR